MTKVRMAVIQDYLCNIAGSERMFQYICEEFPEADAYTLAYNPNATLDYFAGRNIKVTWMNKFVQSANTFKWLFPISTYVMGSVDLRQYDLVLSSSATVAKYVNVPNGKHVCYCYIPTRAIWQFEEYFGDSFKSKLLKLALPYLKKRDYAASKRIDKFVAISNASKEYIKQYYDRESEIIYCPIDLDRFTPSANRKDHYLIVSRLEYWKRLDYAVEAFNRLGLPLRIIGGGEDEQRLKGMSNSNITFLGPVDESSLAREYGEAKAVIFTPFLEYGLIPLEANASGTPVICYGKGGITETMVPLGSNTSPTAVFFYEQTASSLIEAVQRFHKAEFDSSELVRHASGWGVPAFKKNMRQMVNSLMEQK
jgi:glycosyltransferase involved in cell wall biosynthesis